MEFKISLASTVDGLIGSSVSNDLVWGKLTKDMDEFKTNTKNAVMIMGFNTAMSFKNGPVLPGGRISMVVSKREGALQQLQARVKRTHELANVHVEPSFIEALKMASTIVKYGAVDSIWVIGGKMIFEEAFRSPYCSGIVWTSVYNYPGIENNCASMTGAVKLNTLYPDARIFELTHSSPLCLESDGSVYKINTFTRKHEEYQYIEMVRDIINFGNSKGDRTGTGTLSQFGRQMRFSLHNGKIPVLTTKKVFWRGVVEELLWMIRGCTDSKQLAAKKVHIWDDNGTRAFLDNLGLTHREEGDLGPLYGFQWRHWAAEYKDCHTDYTGQGIDQLKQVIETIKKNPNDRRILMSAWNVAELNNISLPACHTFSQFYVANGELNCQMYQRSVDLGLGASFNIASYSLLTIMIAHVCGLQPGEFIHITGDTHVYNNHIEALKEQLTREPKPFPSLKINRTVTDIDDFKFEDFELKGYQSHEAVKMKMAI